LAPKEPQIRRFTAALSAVGPMTSLLSGAHDE
jgi:hypothetical protein